MRRPARPLATWLAVFALVVQTLAFALHGPLRVQADADGSLVICTAEGLQRVGQGRADIPHPALDAACSACATLAAVAGVPPADPAPAIITFVISDPGLPPEQAVLPARALLGPAQPRAPPAWA